MSYRYCNFLVCIASCLSMIDGYWTHLIARMNYIPVPQVQSEEQTLYDPGVKYVLYSLVYTEKSWWGAKESCASSGGQLAVPNNQVELDRMQRILKSGPYKPQSSRKVWIGLFNSLGDGWNTVDGRPYDAIELWANDMNSPLRVSGETEARCAVIDNVNPGIQEFWCYKSQPFLCEYEHVDGNGNGNDFDVIIDSNVTENGAIQMIKRHRHRNIVNVRGG